jgi:hypothetical protein
MNGLSIKFRAQVEPEVIETTLTLEAAIATSNTTNNRLNNSADLSNTSSGQFRKISRINSTTKSEVIKITNLSSGRAEEVIIQKTATLPKLPLALRVTLSCLNLKPKRFKKQKILLMSFTKSGLLKTAPRCRCCRPTKTLQSRNSSKDRNLTFSKRWQSVTSKSRRAKTTKTKKRYSTIFRSGLSTMTMTLTLKLLKTKKISRSHRSQIDLCSPFKGLRVFRLRKTCI